MLFLQKCLLRVPIRNQTSARLLGNFFWMIHYVGCEPKYGKRTLCCCAQFDPIKGWIVVPSGHFDLTLECALLQILSRANEKHNENKTIITLNSIPLLKTLKHNQLEKKQQTSAKKQKNCCFLFIYPPPRSPTNHRYFPTTQLSGLLLRGAYDPAPRPGRGLLEPGGHGGGS